MRALVFAYQEIGCLCLGELIRCGVDVAALVTHPDNPDEEIWFPSAAKLARKHGIPVIEVDGAPGPEWAERAAAFRPDAIFSFMFRKMLPESILAVAPKGAFNLHPSLLPRYRGRCPANWAIINGEERTGLTLHEMVRRADAGAIVAQRQVSIGPDDDIAVLYSRFAAVAPEMLRGVIPLIETGEYPRQVQDESIATKFGGRKPQDGMFSWDWPAKKIHDLVRGVTHPYPGAFFMRDGKKIFVWKTARVGAAAGAPATVLSLSPLQVAAGEGALEILSAQAEGSPEMQGGRLAAQLGLRDGGKIA